VGRDGEGRRGAQPGRKEREEEVVRDDLREHCRTHLASYKAPAYIAFIDELPRNPMGKVLKTDLRRDHGGPDNN
jgi:acyl-CoA synthetase (AMP-forming)/AMP-acid ligase II